MSSFCLHSLGHSFIYEQDSITAEGSHNQIIFNGMIDSLGMFQPLFSRWTVNPKAINILSSIRNLLHL